MNVHTKSALGLLIIVAAGIATCGQSGNDRSHGPTDATASHISARRSFSLIDQHGQPVTDASLRGQWLVVFFGFTHCPDSCPTTLFKLRQTLMQLGEDAGKVRVLFITVDPERDTPSVMKTYLSSFGAQFTGGTGSAAQVGDAARAFRTYLRKQPMAADGSYAIDHSTYIYVVNPSGGLERQLSFRATPDQIAAVLRTSPQ